MPGLKQWSRRVSRAFDAAEEYERYAAVQAKVAQKLARRILIANGAGSMRLLEIGCGTGLLTRELVRAGFSGSWMITDIAPTMVARTEATMHECCTMQNIVDETYAAPCASFEVMDGEWPTIYRPFDLVVASFAFQWFKDLRSSLEQLAGRLAPGGAMFFTMPVAGTFAEWDLACSDVGECAGGILYPDLAGLVSLLPEGGTATVDVEDEVVIYDDARQFLRAVKAVGAGTARSGYASLSYGAMQRAMRAFESTGARVTYRVAYCHWARA